MNSPDGVGAELPDAGESLPRLVAALKDDDIDRSYEAAAELGAQGGRGLPFLIEATRDRRPHVREHAAYGIQQMAATVPKAATAILPLLRDESKPVRRQACVALARFGPGAGTAVEALISLLGRDDAEDVQAAAYALRHIGPGASRAVPRLVDVIRRFKKQDCMTVYEAVRALEAISIQKPDHARVLGELLECDDDLLCTAAADALAKAPEFAKTAAGPLRACLNRKSPSVRIAAAVALGKVVDDDGPIDALVNLVEHQDVDVRTSAMYGLGDLGKRATKAIPYMRAVLGDPDPVVRAAASAALKSVGAMSK